MINYIRLLIILSFMVSNTILLASNQIVISADGTTVQSTENVLRKKNQKVKSNRAKKNNIRLDDKTKNTTMQKSITTNTNNTDTKTISTNDPSEENNSDIILLPDTSGKTFHLHIQTKVSPAFAMITTHDGFFLVMDKKYSFKLPDFNSKTSFINKIVMIDDPKLLILHFILSPYIYANFERKEKNIYLSFFYRDAANIYVQTPSPCLLTLKEKQWPNIVISPLIPGGRDGYVTLNNNRYYVYMNPNPDGGHQQLYSTPYYETVSTSQGFAARIFSTKTKFVINNNQLQISHQTSNAILTASKTSHYFQNIFDVNSRRNLTQERMELVKDKNRIDPPYPVEKQLQWAWINLCLNLGQEAKIYLKTAATQYPKIIHHPLYKALLGMSYYLNQEYSDALNSWKTVPNTLEIALWKQLAASATGRCEGIDQIIFTIGPIFENYPTQLREILMKHSFKIAENLHNLGAVYLLLESKKERESLSLQWMNTLYQAKILYEKKEYDNVKKTLKKMNAQQYQNEITPDLLVETEFLSTLNNLKLHKQLPKDAIKTFDDLRLKWRGGGLEYRITQELILLLESENRFYDALNQLSGLKRLFPNRSEVNLISKEIQNIYIKYFDNINNVSPLKVIKTYDDFLEFIPEGKNADKIIKIVGEQFAKIDLLDEEAELLSRNIENQIDSKDKINIIFKIIDVNMHNQKYDAALAFISSFPYEIATLDEKSKLLILQAEALLGKGKDQEALAILSTSTNPDHTIFAAKIYAQNKQWRQAAEKLAPNEYLVDKNKHLQKFIDILNNLSIYYSMYNQKDKLHELGQKYQDLMKGQEDFLFLTRNNNNKIKGRADAEASLADINNVSTFIKKQLAN